MRGGECGERTDRGIYIKIIINLYLTYHNNNNNILNMNREIKFRGWNPATSIMFDWSQLMGSAKHILFASDSYKWMQYTGLVDKNGDEIYEGDIVRGSWGDYLQPQVIVYQAPAFVMKTRIKGKGIRLSKSWSEFVLASTEKQLCIILGNIHENPELLTI